MAEEIKINQYASDVNRVGLETAKLLIRDTKSNILLSPPGIYSSVQLLYMGASKQTRTELNTFLYAGSGYDESILANQNIETHPLGESAFWISENAVFYSPNHLLLSDYKNLVEKYTPTLLLPLNGSSDIRLANKWVKDKTHNMIDNLLGDNDIGIDLLIANVNYFSGKWKKSFLKEMTQVKTFHCQDKSESKIKMMERKGKYRYLKNEDFEMIELPYSSDKFSTLMIVPSEKSNISALLQNSHQLVAGFEKESSTLYGRVQIPLFTIDKEYTLKKILMKLGLNSIFFANQANFDNMFIQAKGIYVDDLKHRAVLKVNEEGTEAASLTKVSFLGSLPDPKLDFNFIADKPFIFLVRDVQTKLLLYIAVIRYL